MCGDGIVSLSLRGYVGKFMCHAICEPHGLCKKQRWESSGFHLNSGFLRVPGAILEIHLNLRRNVICVCSLQTYSFTLQAPNKIWFTIYSEKVAFDSELDHLVLLDHSVICLQVRGRLLGE